MRIDVGSQAQQAVFRAFVAVCQADERVAAAFLGGAHAKGSADEHSDLDLYLVVRDEAYDDFFAGRETFLRRLGELLFLDHFGGFGFDLLIFTFAGGAQGELAIGRTSAFDHIHGGPFLPLVDKEGLLAGKTFALLEAPPERQRAALRATLGWFWRHLWKFSVAIHRRQLWSAYVALDAMRLACVNLLRLHHDFATDPEGYWKVEPVVPAEELAPLLATFTPLERDGLVQAAGAIVEFYRQVAPPVAAAHGFDYPADLDRMGASRLEALRGSAHPDR
ncbi:MAG TPA: aminoglycoside 6-adenylyltransferase [Ardenticatenaceae bacterium]|nr:aminoglycoside 6-adenylyltransferase [Ardenticatenaceae bacterium]